MTMPRSLTSSRYTGAPALRSLERTSVVSIITSRPIHASGIGPPCGAAGLCLSIMVHSSARLRPRPPPPPPPPPPLLGGRPALRGGRPLPVHHGPLLCSLAPTAQDTPAEPGPRGLPRTARKSGSA